MAIVGVVKTLVGQMTSNGGGYSFGLGNSGWQNYFNDEDADQGVYLDQPITNKLELNSRMRTYEPSIYFWFRTKFDATPEQQDASAIIKAETAINEFVVLADQSLLVNELSDVTELETHNTFDGNSSGKIITMKLKPSATGAVCV